MVVDNQSNGSVNWSQSGSNPDPESLSADNLATEDISGNLTQSQQIEFTPISFPPWWVVFSGGHEPVVSEEIRDADATVTLNAAWKIEIT